MNFPLLQKKEIAKNQITKTTANSMRYFLIIFLSFLFKMKNL